MRRRRSADLRRGRDVDDVDVDRAGDADVDPAGDAAAATDTTFSCENASTRTSRCGLHLRARRRSTPRCPWSARRPRCRRRCRRCRRARPTRATPTWSVRADGEHQHALVGALVVGALVDLRAVADPGLTVRSITVTLPEPATPKRAPPARPMAIVRTVSNEVAVTARPLTSIASRRRCVLRAVRAEHAGAVAARIDGRVGADVGRRPADVDLQRHAPRRRRSGRPPSAAGDRGTCRSSAACDQDAAVGLDRARAR